ncbi:MAG: lycopene cyclase family protein [Bacteroidota bacterium]
MKYDYIIAGAGLAGLSLCLSILESKQLQGARILLLDKDAKQSNDRTWSFWSKDIGELSKIVQGQWKRAKVYTPEQQSLSLHLHPYQYYTIRGLDFYRYAFEKINAAANVQFLQTEILKCDSDGQVTTQDGTFQGDWVFKSYFDLKDVPSDTKATFVWQHFKGWEIETEEDCFNPEELTMMDFRIADEQATKFFYVLPFAPNRALVEYTEFSATICQQDAYDGFLKQYIRQNLGITNYRVVEEECNAIPMTDHNFGRQLNGRILTIGTMAGYVKPSSGYCFTRTLARNHVLVEMLEQGKQIDPQRLSSDIKYQWYDATLLHVMSQNRVFGHDIFASLFRRLSGSQVFKFLDEQSSLLEDLQIMLAVPGKIEFAKFFFRRALSDGFYRFRYLFLGR